MQRGLNIATSCYQRGLRRYQEGEFLSAKEDFSRTISLYPNDPNAYFQRAIAYFSLANYTDAIADLTTACTLQPNNIEYLRWRAGSYYKIEGYEKAIYDYNAILKIDPNHIKVQENKNNTLNALYKRGNDYFGSGEYEKAIADYEFILKVDPHHIQAQNGKQTAQGALHERKLKKRAQKQAVKAEEEPLNQAKAKYPELDQLLASKEWKKADQKTTEIMLKISGRTSEGYLDENACKNFPPQELKMIDLLWVHHSKDQFGFSVQKEIWTSAQIGGKVGEYDSGKFCEFGNAVHWLKGGSWVRYDSLAFSTSINGHLPSLGVAGGGVWGGVFLFLLSSLNYNQ